MKTKSFPLLLMLIFFLAACEKDAEIGNKDYPFVITQPVEQIDSTGASFSANVPNAEDFRILDFGFKWSNSTEEFSCSLPKGSDFSIHVGSDLKKGQSIICRAYVKTYDKLIYGNSVSFISKGSSPPLISGFSPKQVSDKAKLIIRGSNFSSKTNKNHVFINKIEAPVLSASTDSIMCTIPEMSFYGDTKIEVLVDDKKTTSAISLTILGPEIENVSAKRGFAGDYLTINGQNLTLNSPRKSLFFGDIEADILSVSDTKIEAIIPTTYYEQRLFIDMNVPLRYQNGMKSVTNDNFVIAHSWTKKSSMGYNTTQSRFFTYNNRAYIHDIWQPIVSIYDPENDTWQTEKADYFPHNTSGALYITNGNSLYLLGGQNWLGEPYNDLWVFDIPQKTWSKKGTLPFNFWSATYFETPEGIHIITDSGEHWKCDFVNQKYVQLRNFPENFSFSFGFAFQSGNNFYMMVAERTFQYDENSDLWTEKKPNPIKKGGYNQLPVGFPYRNNGYVYDTRSNFIYRYDSERDFWVKSAYVPISLINIPEISFFVLNDMVYFEDIHQDNAFMVAFKDFE